MSYVAVPTPERVALELRLVGDHVAFTLNMSEVMGREVYLFGETRDGALLAVRLRVEEVYALKSK